MSPDQTKLGGPSATNRRLSVRNFSVIKEADLEFGKITVLIGPQASGKSLLCKLAFFLGREVIEIAASSAMKGFSLEGFRRVVMTQFIQRFSSHSGMGGRASIGFLAGRYSIEFDWDDFRGNEDVSTAFSKEFERLYLQLAASRASRTLPDVTSQRELQNDIWTSLSRLLADGVMYDTLFIPADRSLFTDANKGFVLVQSPGIDPLVSRFGAEVLWGGKWKPGSLTAGDNALAELNHEMARIAGGAIHVNGGEPVFKANDGREIPLTLLSSGTQELMHLLNVLDRLATQQEHRQVYFHASADSPQINSSIGIKVLIYLEEPEANIFPSTQFDLVRLLAWLSSRSLWDFSWVITTHSPYILTAFNSLIEARRAGNKAGKREQVAAVVPEKYWVNENDFAAYTIRDGVLTPIFQKETEGVEGSGLIDGDYLDSVSDEIGGQFEKLLDIEYAE
jgi:hypothetical protein